MIQDRYTLTSALGTLDLHTAPYVLAAGPTGHLMPPVRLTVDRAPARPGGILTDTQHDARRLTLPLAVYADTRADTRAAIRTLARHLDPTRGPVTLTALDTVTGDTRQLTELRYASGLEGDETGDPAGLTHTLLLELVALNPYWSAPAPTTVTWSGADSSARWFPLFPLRLSSGRIGSTQTVNNPGDVPTWPRWRINGPASNISITNQTTGARLDLPTVTLDAAGWVDIDTRPGYTSVRNQAGANLAATVNLTTSTLWPLTAGPNIVRVEADATTAISSAEITYTPRWLTR